MPDTVVERRGNYPDIHKELGAHGQSIIDMKDTITDLSKSVSEVTKEVSEIKTGQAVVNTKVDSLTGSITKFIEKSDKKDEQRITEDKKNLINRYLVNATIGSLGTYGVWKAGVFKWLTALIP